MDKHKKNNIIRNISYDIKDDNFKINTRFNIKDIKNGMRFLLILPIELPKIENILPVYIIIRVNNEETQIPIQDIIGNNLMSDQLEFLPKNENCKENDQKIVRMVYGSNPDHFKILQSLPNTKIVE